MGVVQFCAHEQAADVNFEVAIKPMDGCIRRQPIRIFPKEAKAISESRGRERRGGKCRSQKDDDGTKIDEEGEAMGERRTGMKCRQCC